jgi:hypothetical protein
MRQIGPFVLVAVLAAFGATPSFAECRAPAAPDKFPEPQTATEENMVAAQQMVKSYLAEMETALKCMDNTRHDAALDDMKKVAAKFNTVLRAYRAKQSG